MRRKAFILLLAIPLLMAGQTYLKDGMKLRTRIIGTHDPTLSVGYQVATIEQLEEGNNFNVYKSHKADLSDNELIAVIKTEDSKVFFRLHDSNNDEWYLLYDFGLKPGEGCYVYSPRASSTPYKTYVKCVGIVDNFESTELTALQLEEYLDDSCDFLDGQGFWLKGLSSTNGFLQNNGFNLDGAGTKLIEISDGQNIIYLSKDAGVSDIIDSSDADIKISGSDIYVSTNDEVCGSLYSQSGAHIGNYTFGKTPLRINLSPNEVYILKIGNNSTKILIP